MPPSIFAYFLLPPLFAAVCGAVLGGAFFLVVGTLVPGRNNLGIPSETALWAALVGTMLGLACGGWLGWRTARRIARRQRQRS